MYNKIKKEQKEGLTKQFRNKQQHQTKQQGGIKEILSNNNDNINNNYNENYCFLKQTYKLHYEIIR